MMQTYGFWTKCLILFFHEDWVKRSQAHFHLIRILNGQCASLDWGEKVERVFVKTQNLPIILLGVGSAGIALAFRNEIFSSRLLSVKWDGACPVGELTAERIAATIFKEALELHLRKQ